MSTETISIILPIYNVEPYIKQCLCSLIAQTYKNLEIILVNDGSTDSSLEICRAYAKIDPRIMIINKQNEGVAIARNIGMEKASGTYIAFVDPDDWIEPEMYDALLKQLKKWEAPVCLCNFYKDYKKKSQAKLFEFDKEVLVGDEIIEYLINDMIGVADLLPKYTMIMGSVWRGLYLRQFLKENQLTFIPKVSIMEDLIFMIKVLLKCEKVAIDSGVWYHYVQHSDSNLHSYNEQLWEHQLIVYQHLEQSLKETGLEEQLRNRLDTRYIGMILTTLKNEMYTKKEGDFKETLGRIKEILTDDTLKSVLERIKPIQNEKKKKKL